MTPVATFYLFADLPDPAALKAPLTALAHEHGVRGTVLLASEGINGTLAGARPGLEAMLACMRAEPALAGLNSRWSQAEDMPFARFKLKLRDEIVTMGHEEVRPADGVGRYVAPEEWNAVVADAVGPDAGTVLIDTRNDYEVAIGTFEGAIDPELKSFGDFPAWWDDHADRFAGKRVAMFCTGGIRCEKSTAYLKSKGVDDVVHLRGGILDYLARVPEEDSRWRGECFVFDQRVALAHGLVRGEAAMCHACRRPVTAAQVASPEWEEGVSCPICIDEFGEADRARFRERQRQIRFAAARGERHLA